MTRYFYIHDIIIKKTYSIAKLYWTKTLLILSKFKKNFVQFLFNFSYRTFDIYHALRTSLNMIYMIRSYTFWLILLLLIFVGNTLRWSKKLIVSCLWIYRSIEKQLKSNINKSCRYNLEVSLYVSSLNLIKSNHKSFFLLDLISIRPALRELRLISS